VDAPLGDDPAAVLARIEVEAADIDSALADLGKLADATRAPAQAWIAKAQARQAALTAARQFAADTARALGPEAGAR
jgi:CBS-domain-containing membrane protein